MARTRKRLADTLVPWLLPTLLVVVWQIAACQASSLVSRTITCRRMPKRTVRP